MSTRDLLVLGSASQVPTRYRNHNGYLLRWDGVGLLFDPGEGTQRQMTRYGVSAHQLHRVFITHFHGDHCLGLPGVIQRISLDEVPHQVTVHYPRSGQAYFERLRYASIYRDRARLAPTPHDADGPIGVAGSLTFTTARLDHDAPAWGYRVQEADGWTFDPDRLAARGLRGPVIRQLSREGRVIEGGVETRIEDVATPRRGQSMAFLMDTRPCPAMLDLARGVDLLVCEATFLDAHRADAHAWGHLTAVDAAKLAVDAGARRLVLTHFSQRYGNTDAHLAEASALHPDVVAAHDGLVVPVPPRSGP